MLRLVFSGCSEMPQQERQFAPGGILLKGRDLRGEKNSSHFVPVKIHSQE